MNRFLVAMAATFALGVAPAKSQTGTGFGFEFDTAMSAFRLPLDHVDGNLDRVGRPNGLLDADELALVAVVLNDMSLDLRRTGGVTHEAALKAFVRAELRARAELAPLRRTWPQASRLAAGYALLGRGSLDAFAAMAAGFGSPMSGDYEQAANLGRFFSAEGDADGDGVSNHDEYLSTIAQGRAAYLKAALDPTVRPSRPANAAALHAVTGLPRGPSEIPLAGCGSPNATCGGGL